MNLRTSIVLALASLPLAAHAEDLMQVYRDARSYDAQYAAARYALQAGMEKLPQGRALLLPDIGLTASTTRTDLNTQPRNPGAIAALPLGQRHFETNGYQLTLTQPVYREQNFLQYDEAGYQVKQAEATFGQAGEDLILRVAQAYFDVLGAQDTIELVRAQRKAIAEQLQQAKRNFEVGTATIVDTHDAQARYDLAAAQEIAAQNDLDNKKRVLEQITGKVYASLEPLRPDVKLSLPQPNSMDAWVGLAEKHAYPVQFQEAGTEIAQLEAKRAQAGHYPTLDFVATYGSTDQTGNSVSSFGTNVDQGTLGFQFALPLYQGGSISSRAREAAANYEQGKETLANARRTSALNAQQSYLAVANGVAQVGALEQALVSSQSALDSNKLGYEVGVRIEIDVLNAQQQVYSTKRDLALARYNTITSELKLKASGGSLDEQDLQKVNAALEH
ncbi:MAG TPA: TolC family outer membrane protein [Burkholderiales bacterium]|nr:TolC family outer membrane protein [Burkholderiales bacterium]